MKTLDELQTDIIDSRDLIDAMEEWGNIIEDEDATSEEIEEAKENLEELQEFCKPFQGYGDWDDGETLISADYWVEYVEELLKDIGDLPTNIPWYIAIDWEETAANIAVDYIKENDYYMRA